MPRSKLAQWLTWRKETDLANDLTNTIERFRARMVIDLIEADKDRESPTVVVIDELPSWRVLITKSRHADVWLAQVQRHRREGWICKVDGAKAFEDAFDALTSSYACLHELTKRAKGRRWASRPWAFIEMEPKLKVYED